MHNATHVFTTNQGSVYVRLVIERDNFRSTARVVSDERTDPYLPGEQITVMTEWLVRL